MNEGFCKNFYRKNNSVKRSRLFSERFVLTCLNGISGDSSGSVWPWRAFYPTS